VTEGRCKFAFVLEQTFGQVAHTRNLEQALSTASWIDGTVVKLPFDPARRLGHIPGIRNWSLRASLMARRELRRRLRQGALDAAFIHTQVASLLSVGIMRSVATVVSLDATPLNFDSVGEAYGHRRGGPIGEAFKTALNQRAYLAAAAMVTWSHLAADSLAADYGVPSARIHVIRPGVDLARFRPPAERRREGPVRVLFVGGDFVRKGGADLLDAMRGLVEVEVDVVTTADVAVPPDVQCRVHRGLAPGDQRLVELYGQADLFALPTRGDCLPQVLAEAAAAGLPIVATPIGAVPEVVQDGRNGLLVPVGTPSELRLALRRLAESPELRSHMGRESRALAEQEHDATANNGRIFELMADVAHVRSHRQMATGPG